MSEMAQQLAPMLQYVGYAPPKPGTIHTKMAAILKDVEAIGKNARNQQQGFNYRGIDDVYNTLNPVLAKHGVYMTSEILNKTREERTTIKSDGKQSVLAFTCLRMRYRFHAEDGSSVTTEVEGEGMDSGDKSSNKAMAIAHKYALLQAFCIPTKDLDDPDAQTHEVAPQKAPIGSPEGVTTLPKPDRKAAANKWGNAALEMLPTMDGPTFAAWRLKYANAVAEVRDFNEALHKRLTDAILKRSLELSRVATAAE